MFEWPDVVVQICTYNRTLELDRTITALLKGLMYPAEKTHWLICDDCGHPNTRLHIETRPFFTQNHMQWLSTSVNSGWGANVNNGLDHILGPYVFFIEDDYVLQDGLRLDLEAAIALMECNTDLGMLRFRGTAGEHLVFHQMECDVSKMLPSYQEGFGVPGKLTYLLLDGGSPGLYIYSNGPHLKRRSFHDFYGRYPEGLALGDTEEKFAHIVKDGMKIPGAPTIGILPEWIPMQFDHIGKSYQHTVHDRVR